MRLSFFLLLVILTEIPASQTHYDTLSSFPVGPGVVHTTLHAPLVPWVINVLEIDMRNPFIKMETAKANDRLAGYERPSSMANRKSYPGHVVVGAVNGDFYGGTGVPISIQVAQGEVLRSPIDKSTLGFDTTGRMMLQRVDLGITVRTPAGTRVVNNVNAARNTDQLILYNRYMGPATGTNVFGAEAVIRPLGGWFANDTMLCVVDTIVSGVGNMSISAGKAVLSGHGTSQSWILSSLRTRDTVKLYQRVNPGIPRLKELIGGFPKIVANGANYVDQGYIDENGPSHTYERHPRTGAGFTADSSRLFLITVDGRQSTSAGMTLHELANFMLTRGIAWGINFDGGGSTAMVVRGSVVNSPSDGGTERAVSNALLAVSSAPLDTLSTIIMAPKARRIFRGESYRFQVRGFDRYGNPRTLNPSLIQFNVRPGLGTIDSSGLFTAADIPDSGYLHVRYGQFRDSAYVTLKTISRVVLTPGNVVTDTLRSVQFTARAYDSDGIEKYYPAGRYFWQSLDTTVGRIDTTGVFRGRATGQTLVRAAFDNISDTARVRVEIGAGRVTIDSLESLAGWILSGRNIDTSASRLTLQTGTSTLGSHSFRIYYRFIGDPSVLNYIHLDAVLPVFGVPDSIILDVKADSSNHRLFYYITDDNGEEFKISSTRFITAGTGFDSVKTRFFPVGTGSFNFPVRLKRIEIQLGGARVLGQVNSGVILIDHLRVSYPASITSVPHAEGIPANALLSQNYPNPFNPTTMIRYNVPDLSLANGQPGGEGINHVTLKVFDLLGREVATLVDEVQDAGEKRVLWDASGFASGVYFYRLQARGSAAVRRMVLIR